jgi:hypothetical protein
MALNIEYLKYIIIILFVLSPDYHYFFKVFECGKPLVYLNGLPVVNGLPLLPDMTRRSLRKRDDITHGYKEMVI